MQRLVYAVTKGWHLCFLEVVYPQPEAPEKKALLSCRSSLLTARRGLVP